jgi:hypothetical protein
VEMDPNPQSSELEPDALTVELSIREERLAQSLNDECKRMSILAAAACVGCAGKSNHPSHEPVASGLVLLSLPLTKVDGSSVT